MKSGSRSVAIFVLGLAWAGITASAQQPSSRMQGPPEGTLTVTLTVAASVGIVEGPDGEQRMVFANAVDPRDNVSQIQQVRRTGPAPVAADGKALDLRHPGARKKPRTASARD